MDSTPTTRLDGFLCRSEFGSRLDCAYGVKSSLCLWELDILRHSTRKLRTYEEIHTVFARYIRCDGIYRFLSAGGNDSYGRTC
jgi:hypothetical protein